MDDTLKAMLAVAADRAEETGHWLTPFLRFLATGKEPGRDLRVTTAELPSGYEITATSSLGMQASTSHLIRRDELVRARSPGELIDLALVHLAHKLHITTDDIRAAAHPFGPEFDGVDWWR
jgi:hypothetical protein